MEEGLHLPYIREIVVFLVTASILVPIFQRLAVSPVLGFLGVGMAIGPYGLGLLTDSWPWLSYVVIDDIEGVRALSELGVVFLLFMIGLELSLDRLWSMRRLVFGLGGAQVLICGAAIFAFAYGWGNALNASILLGAGLALSSTAVVTQSLIERGALSGRLGRTSFSILLFQDLAVVPILFVLGLMAGQHDGSPWVTFGLAVLQGVAAVAAILLLGRVIVRPLLRLVAGSGARESFVALTLLLIIGTAMLTGVAGLSIALGALLAGLLLAESEYRHQVSADIEPFKGLLLGLFFLSVGLGLNVRAVLDNLFWVVASVGGLYVIKASLIAALCRLTGQPTHIALPAGLLLGQAGEFGFVVVGLAMAGGIIGHETGQFMLLVAGVTMAMTPFVVDPALRLSDWLERRHGADGLSPGEDDFVDVEGHVVIAGYGRVGQAIAHLLDSQQIPYVALDMRGALVSEMRRRGCPIYYGDATSADILGTVGAERASAVVVTLDEPDAAGHAIEEIRRRFPHLPVFGRAHDLPHADVLEAKGASGVVPETAESSLQLARMVMDCLGVPGEAINAVAQQVREQDYRPLHLRGRE